MVFSQACLPFPDKGMASWLRAVVALTDPPPATANSQAVLVLAWRRRDAELTVELLARERVAATVCENATALCASMEAGAGVVIVAEEALTLDAVARIEHCLARQPPWSDFPFVVFTGSRTLGGIDDERWSRLGNVALLERPVRVRAMLAAVRAALRARRRQYDARRAIEARDQFLAMLGHELRNPLAAVRLAASLLAENDPQHAARHRSIIDRQTQHLARLIDDLLDIARVTYGKVSLRPEPLFLDALLQGCCHSLDQAFRDRGISLTLSLQPNLPVRGDRVRLEQVFSNLLQNAIKYTPTGGSVEVSARSKRSSVVVVIRDTGVGLDAEVLSRIFDLFAQVDRSLDRAQGGLGIGLTLVRSLVQLHGGTVHAKSEGLGRGAEFQVELPVAQDTQVREETAQRPSSPVEFPARVVLVEDGEDIRDLLKELLEMEGHAVFTASDGPTGIERILAIDPDIAFIDIGLPDLDGYEVARQVRANGSRTRLVALTGYGQKDDRLHARRVGFDRHLTKPVSLTDIQSAMGGLARRSESDSNAFGQ
jgi:signal transduction histidine kinase/ActR/RegA family two-component response regulator